MLNESNSNPKITRRKFIAGASAAAALMAQTALAAPDVSTLRVSSGGKRKLFIIHLSGGNDGINTLVPYSSQKYYKARPTLSLKRDELIKLDSRYAFNSAMREVAELFKTGLVAAFPNTGCRDGLTMSHERASEIWRTAKPNSVESDDWFSPLKETVSFITLEGFDTHADQKNAHYESLRALSELVGKISSDEKDALIFVYSEFGRSLEENETGGTEHGGNGLTLVIGNAVRGGVYDAEVDFRQLYKTVAQNWFQSTKADAIANDSFATLNFV